jgi:hypothetical protein
LRRGTQSFARLPRRAHDELTIHDLGVAKTDPVAPPWVGVMRISSSCREG